MIRTINLSQNWNNKLACNQFSIILPKDVEKNVINDLVDIRCKDVTIHAQIVYIKHFRKNGLTAGMTRINFNQPRRGGETILKRMYGGDSQNIDNKQFSYIIVKRLK